VPGAIVRAYHEAATAKGPAVIVVPMDDWAAPAPEPHEVIGPAALLRSQAADPGAVDAPAALLDDATRPAIVAGAANDGWAELVGLAERLGAPVFQEPFGAQAGFPQDHPSFAGHLPSRRARLREALKPYDAVLVVGTGALRQYPYDPGPLVEPTTRLALITSDPEEAHRSPVEVAVLGSPAAVTAALTHVVEPRERTPTRFERPAPLPPGPLRAGHVLQALADRLPRDAILIEETPSSRPELHARIPATTPLGFLSAMGMLGFALPAAIGLKLALPDRTVLTVVGDGSSLYQIQALWTAAAYEAGVLFVVLRNGGYAIMDRLAEWAGSPGPWPALDAIDIAAMARAQGCEARTISEYDDLAPALDDALRPRRAPLLLEVVVAQDEAFDP
jgi:benzoylformate decarboxylase